MEKPRRVALLVTCLVDEIMPEIGLATVRLLQRAGLEVDFPTAQGCCGQPFYNSGFRDQATDLARRTIEVFEPYDYVVAPSGSCVTMVRVEYPHLFSDQPDWQRRSQALAAKTYELSQFLVQVLGWQPSVEAAGRGKPITYHDSCHMRRLLGLRDEPRQLLAAAGAELHEMEESERCCGFGGLFSLRLPETSNAMTADKLRQALKTQASILVTADPGCLMQIRGLLGDEERLQARHLAVVLEELTRPAKPGRTEGPAS
jgi:L-lactate dehydrogenase complex protein LldE